MAICSLKLKYHLTIQPVSGCRVPLSAIEPFIGFGGAFCFSAMSVYPEPSWGQYHFFPLAFETTQSSKAFRTEHIGNENFDFFDRKLSAPLWEINLGGLSILPQFIDEWDAFHSAVGGMWKPFLFRVHSKRFTVEKEQLGGIGTGDGVKTQFQIVKVRSYPNGPENTDIEAVKFVWHNYPEMRVPVGNPQSVDGSSGTLLYPTAYVRIWVDGVEKLWLDGWDLDRETGIVTFDEPPAEGALVQASCLYFVLLHGQDSYGLSLQGGVWKFPDGARLFQVPSER
jgi:hypothetical protein